VAVAESPERPSLWQAFGITAVVAIAATLGVAPYVYYLSRVAFATEVAERMPLRPPAELVRSELLSIAFVVVVAALVGTLFARRYGLAGVGDRTSIRRAGKLLLLGAPMLGVASYLLFGRVMAARIPGYYPSSLGWALGHVLKGALFDEVVARFGMMTILCGIVRRPMVANLLQAIFFTLLALLGLSFFGLRPSGSAFFVASLVATFATHLVLGAVYARFGLVPAMLFHLGMGIQYPLHVLLGTL
jgi:hypothetical protein